MFDVVAVAVAAVAAVVVDDDDEVCCFCLTVSSRPYGTREAWSRSKHVRH